MKLKKKFLSLLTVFAMTVSMIPVGGVIQAEAAEYTQFGTYSQGEWADNQRTTSWDFTTNMPTGSNQKLLDNDMINELLVTSVGEGGNINKSSYLSLKAGSEVKIPVDDSTIEATVAIKLTSSSEGRTITIAGDEHDFKANGNPYTYNISSENISDGYITMTMAGGELKIGTITLVETKSADGSTESGDTESITSNIYAQYKAENDGEYTIRFVLPLSEEEMAVATEAGAKITVDGKSETFTGTTLYSSIMANGEEVAAENAFVVVDVTNVPAGTEFTVESVVLTATETLNGNPFTYTAPAVAQ